MPTNHAAWLPAKMAHPYTIDEAVILTPTTNQVLVRVRAVAANPADVVIQDLGVVYESYPIIPGCDMAGDIVEIGPDVEGFKVGDRVAGLLYSGAFQMYCAANARLLTKVPHEIEFKQACVVPLGFATAAVCLFEKDMLALNYPRLEEGPPNEKALFVWGGSSAVGSCAVQQANAAGYEVATTAREHNFEYCRRLGAKHIFDHTKPNVVEEIVKALDEKDSAGVFRAVNAEGVVGKCGQIADRLGGNKFVSIPLPPPVPVPDQVPEGAKVGQCKCALFWQDPGGPNSRHS